MKLVQLLLLVIVCWLIYPPAAIVLLVLALISNIVFRFLLPAYARCYVGPLPAWMRNTTAAHLLLAGVAIIVLIVIVCFLQILMYP
jgi:hypothetical protein